MRLRFAIGCLLCLAIAASPAGSAASRGTSSVVNSFPPQPGPGGTSLLGGLNANVVTLDIDPDAGEYVVSDTAGITAGNDCAGVNPETARCTRYSFPGERFRARLRSGDDVFQMVSQVPGRLILKGGEGADKLLAGAGGDVAFGGDGPDTLSGRAGPDRLFGERGRDKFIGGDGDDRLHADDGNPDQAINCGAGDDIAFVDRGRDPKRIRCERVK